MRLHAIDDLDALDLPGGTQEIEQYPIERQRAQIELIQLGHGDVLDEASAGMGFRIRVVETVDVLDQSVSGAAVALREQIGSGVGAVRRNAPHAGRVLPQRERRVSVANDAGRSEEHTSELQSRLHLVCRL